MIEFLLRGLLIGFSIAAPVGPIGVLCIRRSLAHGRLSGLASGLGAASADAVYGGVAALGLTLISAFLVEQQAWLRLVGGVFLVYLGLKTLLGARACAQQGGAQHETAPSRGRLLGDYASTFFLTLTNPMTIISFAAVFAGLGLGSANSSPAAALALVLGVFLGSAAWWLLLSSITQALGAHFLKPGGLKWINRLSGAVIAAFGLAALLSLLI
ncbi:MAG: LysE family translocator [Anaerolineales bacterium]|nr:LysE family translocator [Anaerolineales bacterium]